MNYSDGKLKVSKNHIVQNSTISPGVHDLDIGHARDGLIYIPKNHKPPYALAVMLHGAGGKAEHMLTPFKDIADHTGTVLLIPDSRKQTWDVIMGGIGPDVHFIDMAIEKTFKNISIQPDKICVGGFSDGASYALTIGISNGSFFSHVMAFSPGFMAPPQRDDSPPIFISHGTRDRVLNIDHCSHRLVPKLKGAGFDVIYREFDGEHTIPSNCVKEAFSWFLGREHRGEVDSSKVRIETDMQRT